MDYDALDDAFHYVSDAPPGERGAVVHRASGKIFLSSLKARFDDRPVGYATDPDLATIPHRQELDPGKPLVLEFVRKHCPQELSRVEVLFARPGAFRNLKDLLRRKNLLVNWQIFEEQRIEELLRQWCADQKLPL